MSRKLLKISPVLIVLPVLYVVSGMVVFSSATRVHPCGVPASSNVPEKNVSDVSGWEAFDTRPYWFSGYESIRIPSNGGKVQLHAWYRKGALSRATVILVHGFSGCKGGLQSLLAGGMLAKAGLGVVLFDLRNHGQSTITTSRFSAGATEHRDLLNVRDWVVQNTEARLEDIGFYGVSAGGAVAILAAQRDKRVPAVFADSPYSDMPRIIKEELGHAGYPVFLSDAAYWAGRGIYGLDLLEWSPLEALKGWGKTRLYLVHNRGDRRVRFHHSQSLESVAQRRGVLEGSWYVDGGGHATAALMYPKRYEQRLVTFFKMRLNP